MKKIVLKEGFAFLYLNKNFYNKENILESLKEYKDFFKGHFTDLGKYFIIKVENTSDYETKTLAEEFANFLISKEYEIKTND